MKDIVCFINEKKVSKIETKLSNNPELEKLIDIMVDNGFKPISVNNTNSEMLYDMDDNLTFKTPEDWSKWAMSSKNAVETAYAEIEQFAKDNHLVDHNPKEKSSYNGNYTINPRQIWFDFVDDKGKGVSLVISKNYSAFGLSSKDKFSEELMEDVLP